MSESFHADVSAVAAVREGDRDRYRELVERYADQVFAVAWCRLGDRDLAEEATQEAFIKGYQKLGFLGRAETFGVWITAIARNVAINLGLKHRRELLKRKRWALEQATSNTDTQLEGGDLRESELLSETLASLPALHRECLVLFYLERQSISEAAQRLGISPTAFKTRLHRARMVLREHLENRLLEALPEIRPRSGVLNAVMVALPMHKPVWSLGSFTVAGVTKLLPVWALPVVLQVVGLLPALALHLWFGRKEVANLREPQGFRAVNLRRFWKRTFIFVASIMIVFGVMARAMDLRTYFQMFAIVLGVMIAMSARSLWLARVPHVRNAWIASLILWFAFLGIGFFNWSFAMLGICQGLFFLIVSSTASQVPLRMDWSLFLRAQQGLLGLGRKQELAPERICTVGKLWDFARFLGSRLLVQDWRRGTGFLRLKLTPVTPSQLQASFPVIWGDASTVTLDLEGNIESHIGEKDRRTLCSLPQTGAIHFAELERTVAAALAAAWASFRDGHIEQAEALLGEETVETLYKVAPQQAIGTRGRVWALRIAGIAFLLMSVVYLSDSQTKRAVPPPSRPMESKPAPVHAVPPRDQVPAEHRR